MSHSLGMSYRYGRLVCAKHLTGSAGKPGSSSRRISGLSSHYNSTTNHGLTHVPKRSSAQTCLKTSLNRLISTTSRCSKEEQPSKTTDRSSDHDSKITSQRALSRSVLITGGTSGIGYAVAKQAILEGASHVRITTRDAKRAETAIQKLRDETGTSIELDHIEAEVNDYGESRLFQTKPDSPPFTTIVHCAGMSQSTLLTSLRPEDIQKILSVNLESAALLSRSLLKRYMQTVSKSSRNNTSPAPNHSWQIINISSVLANKGGVGTSIYAASKAGMVALTRAVALEAADVTRRYANVAPGFRANVVLPGYIDTPMTHSFSQSTKTKLNDEIPAGRFGTPDEVADAVMFLLGNEYANNCVLNLDGGLSAA